MRRKWRFVVGEKWRKMALFSRSEMRRKMALYCWRKMAKNGAFQKKFERKKLAKNGTFETKNRLSPS
jgi:hypothetical protein